MEVSENWQTSVCIYVLIGEVFYHREIKTTQMHLDCARLPQQKMVPA